MSGVWGKIFNLSIFGESHGKAIGVVLNGLPSGITLNMDDIEKELERRAPGRDSLSTSRREADKAEIVSGVIENTTTGAPLTALIWNSSQRSKDYEELRYVMRPGHADYPGYIKYKGYNDYRGGGHFSGRITAPLVFAGAIAKQILKASNIYIGSHIESIGNINEDRFVENDLKKDTFEKIKNKNFPVIYDDIGKKMQEKILEAKNDLDSVGGVVEIAAIGVPIGIGEPFFDSVESKVSQLVFSVPGTKGIEFGSGFDIAKMVGSESNDEYYIDSSGKVKTYSNNNGGVTGGITNGMPIIYRVAIKPTSSIAKKQRTIDVKKKEETEIEVHGRHDPCIVHRSVPVLESITAVALLDLVLMGEI